jgi:hypothetical protein
MPSSSCLKTALGVFWATVLSSKRFSPQERAALVVMLAGVALVQPRIAAEAAT